MKIGAISISNRLTLAPMEEHTNFPFRLLMKQAGAGLVVTERIDAADVARAGVGVTPAVEGRCLAGTNL